MRLDEIDLSSVEIELICARYSDDIQGVILYAEDLDGEELTEEQLEALNDSWDTLDYISEQYFLGEL